MGEQQPAILFRPDVTRAVRVEASEAALSEDAGVIALRHVTDRLGLDDDVTEHLVGRVRSNATRQRPAASWVESTGTSNPLTRRGRPRSSSDIEPTRGPETAAWSPSAWSGTVTARRSTPSSSWSRMRPAPRLAPVSCSPDTDGEVGRRITSANS